MIELIGGKHDGRRPRRCPKECFVHVGEVGNVMNPRRVIGVDARYFEENICRCCGVRKGEEPEVRRFLHEPMVRLAECELCGNETMTTTRYTNARQD